MATATTKGEKEFVAIVDALRRGGSVRLAFMLEHIEAEIARFGDSTGRQPPAEGPGPRRAVRIDKQKPIVDTGELRGSHTGVPAPKKTKMRMRRGGK